MTIRTALSACLGDDFKRRVTLHRGGPAVDDHFQYLDPVTGRFFVLPWDPDNTFGSINDLADADIFLNYEKSVITRMIMGGALREHSSRSWKKS
jgi:hypothetical protein